MTNTINPVEDTQNLIKSAVRQELMTRGLSESILKNFEVRLVQDGLKLTLSFPSNFRTLKLNDADEKRFKAAFNAWASGFETAKSGSFSATLDNATSFGIRQVTCSAFNALDMIQGVNQTLAISNQIDANLLGRGK